MDLPNKNVTVSELKNVNRILSYAMLGAVIVILLLAAKLFTQSEIIIEHTPGMPNDAVIEKSTMDKGSQKAILSAVTSAIAQINPDNVEYQKQFIQVFLAPASYTKISKEMDMAAANLVKQHELGSYYFILTRYEYDPALDKHFIWGDVHTVNAARDTAEPYVYEYKTHVENYRLVIDEAISYKGTSAHDTEFLKANKK